MGNQDPGLETMKTHTCEHPVVKYFWNKLKTDKLNLKTEEVRVTYVYIIKLEKCLVQSQMKKHSQNNFS